ncbi:uncharacterized protein [Dysidea avara]|uniref:uncharacterized protein n=1 Tax=Dysidea avara TaxID=196820 RepID=UPI003331C1B3
MEHDIYSSIDWDDLVQPEQETSRQNGQVENHQALQVSVVTETPEVLNNTRRETTRTTRNLRLNDQVENHQDGEIRNSERSTNVTEAISETIELLRVAPEEGQERHENQTPELPANQVGNHGDQVRGWYMLELVLAVAQLVAVLQEYFDNLLCKKTILGLGILVIILAQKYQEQHERLDEIEHQYQQQRKQLDEMEHTIAQHLQTITYLRQIIANKGKENVWLAAAVSKSVQQMCILEMQQKMCMQESKAMKQKYVKHLKMWEEKHAKYTKQLETCDQNYKQSEQLSKMKQDKTLLIQEYIILKQLRVEEHKTLNKTKEQNEELKNHIMRSNIINERLVKSSEMIQRICELSAKQDKLISGLDIHRRYCVEDLNPFLSLLKVSHHLSAKSFELFPWT